MYINSYMLTHHGGNVAFVGYEIKSLTQEVVTDCVKSELLSVAATKNYPYKLGTFFSTYTNMEVYKWVA